MPSNIVSTGRYRYFNRAELEDERANYIAAVKAHSGMRVSAAGGVLNFVGINGKQLTYAFAGDGTGFLDAWSAELANAFAQLAGEAAPHSDRTVVRFQ